MSTPLSSATALDPATTVGAVSLTVRDLDRSRRFYEQAIGLRAEEADDGSLTLSPGSGPPLIRLVGDPSAPGLDPRATGLYHLAILLPSRPDLAVALARLSQVHWPLDGASDHLVSEALYLSDPDGNGIEIYQDRPRDHWSYRDGRLEMATLPLDLRDVLAELPDARSWPQELSPETRIGHVHLQVSDIGSAEAFYHGLLGFDVTVGLPGALFVSAGGYHHHLGLNTWRSAGSSPPPPGSVGLRNFEIVLADHGELTRVLDLLEGAGVPTEGQPDGALLQDPFGNGVRLRVP